MKLERNYSLDLLKIVSVIFVIVLHYNNGTMGGLLSNTQPGTLNFFIAHFTEILTIIACNLFVLISGYFLCKSNKIKICTYFQNNLLYHRKIYYLNNKIPIHYIRIQQQT